MYEELKGWLSEVQGLGRERKLGSVEYLICAALSKLVAAVVTYPYQVVRARLQDTQAASKDTSARGLRG